MPGAVTVVRESLGPAGRPREQAVAHLWRNVHTLSEGLLTQDGRRLRVVYPGRASALAGPDFRDSIIETEDGELLTGDVELHVDACDWESHHHQVDPNYNGVILHVVLHSRGRKTSDQQSGTTAPVASLGPVVGLLGGVESPGRDGDTLLRRLDRESLGELLDRAGDIRFTSRSEGFALELEAGDAEEVLFGALMEALGYSINRRPFRELASRVPMAALRALRGEPGSVRPLAIKAMLVYAAGLLPYVKPAEEAVELRALLGRLPKTKRILPGRWQMFRVRPANHPVRRLSGAAYLVDRYVEAGLVSGLGEDVRRGGVHHLVQQLTVRPFIGVGRAREIAVNVVLPYMHALAGMGRDVALRGRCIELYHAFPKLEDNEITREMRRLLSSPGEGVEIRGARRHQGLIHLYRAMRGRVAA